MNPYILLGGILAFMGAAIGGYTYGLHHQALVDQHAIDAQKVEAANLLASETAKVRDLEAKAAQINSDLETTHAADMVKLADADGRVRDAVARWVRDQAKCRAGRPGTLPGSATAAVAPDPAAGSGDQLAGSLADIARAGNVLAAYARECNAFAITLGH